MYCEVELQIITIQKFEIQTFVSLLKDTANEDGIAGIIVVARFSIQQSMSDSTKLAVFVLMQQRVQITVGTNTLVSICVTPCVAFEIIK